MGWIQNGRAAPAAESLPAAAAAADAAVEEQSATVSVMSCLHIMHERTAEDGRMAPHRRRSHRLTQRLPPPQLLSKIAPPSAYGFACRSCIPGHPINKAYEGQYLPLHHVHLAQAEGYEVTGVTAAVNAGHSM
jgi:hypothetical protein